MVVREVTKVYNILTNSNFTNRGKKMDTLVTTERKSWIDNLRWITILIVVVFHVFFYYNNIGNPALFERLPANPSVEGEKAAFTFAGIFQYAVYQWFMLLLFIVSGICSKYTLQKKSVKQFLKSRVVKLLVPSTLGVLVVHWVSGWVLATMNLASSEAPVPVPVKYVISVLSGIGGLWFCQVLMIACLLLALIKTIDKKGKLESLGQKSNIFVAAGLYIVMLGAAQILNIPMVTTYRMCYYPLAFILGYYVFSSEKLLIQLKKFGWIFLIVGVVAGVFYVRKFYGVYYANYEVLNNWISVAFAWFTALGLLGVAQTILNFENGFSKYMNKAGWGIYVNHITILVIFNYLISSIAANLPIAVIYVLELIVALVVSVGAWELLRRIPFFRYVLYGIKKQKKNKKEVVNA